MLVQLTESTEGQWVSNQKENGHIHMTTFLGVTELFAGCTSQRQGELMPDSVPWSGNLLDLYLMQVGSTSYRFPR